MPCTMKDRLAHEAGLAVLRLSLPMPPTDNNIYISIGAGRRIMSPEAKAFKRAASSAVAELAATSSGVELKKDVPYELVLRIYFEKVLNSGYPKTAKTRYKRVDGHNRQKLVIDAITEAIGVDDCHIFRVTKTKRCDPEDPRIEFELYELADEDAMEAGYYGPQAQMVLRHG